MNGVVSKVSQGCHPCSPSNRLQHTWTTWQCGHHGEFSSCRINTYRIGWILPSSDTKERPQVLVFSKGPHWFDQDVETHSTPLDPGVFAPSGSSLRHVWGLYGCWTTGALAIRNIDHCHSPGKNNLAGRIHYRCCGRGTMGRSPCHSMATAFHIQRPRSK